MNPWFMCYSVGHCINRYYWDLKPSRRVCILCLCYCNICALRIVNGRGSFFPKFIYIFGTCTILHFRPLELLLHWSIQLCQRLTEYGVHLHHVLPEKRSQTGILLGVCSRGVVIFEVHNGARTPVLRFPWRETKKISFSVSQSLTLYLHVSLSVFVSSDPVYLCSLFLQITLHFYSIICDCVLCGWAVKTVLLAPITYWKAMPISSILRFSVADWLNNNKVSSQLAQK